MRLFEVFAVLATLCVSMVDVRLHAQSSKVPPSWTDVVVDPAGTKDSLGETVYVARPKDRSDLPAVPGVLVGPKVIYAPAPVFSEAMMRDSFRGAVAVMIHVTAQGKAIDLQVSKKVNFDAAVCAERAVGQYRFQPATLDGKPVAFRMFVSVEMAISRNE